jgi:hypothetical protein
MIDRRSNPVEATMFNPATAIEPNIIRVAPPNTDWGMAWNTPPTTGTRPRMMGSSGSVVKTVSGDTKSLF